MKLTELLEDDGAVSPVIGVILMVAVTVILAAVIASFVLGLGSSTSAAPNAGFAADFDDGGDGAFGSGDDSDRVEIIHDGGDAIDASQVRVSVNGNVNSSASWSSSEITAGDRYVIDESWSSNTLSIESDDTIRVTWQSQENKKSSTLWSTSAP